MLKHRQTLVYVISYDHHSLNFFSPFVYTFSYSKQEIQRKSLLLSPRCDNVTHFDTEPTLCHPS